ncbi:hypothetical protein [Clostridium arbusti]|uniref:hypothetical protein n=1 Tax=Clostridium arbusti TaxID=1137848 RepID=UPI00028A1B1A|nr:hypothetical protein [Clostridium arbusti]
MKKSLITILFIVVALNIVVPVYGETNDVNQSNTSKKNAALASGFIHPKLSVETVLKENLGFTAEEIEKCKSSGGNAFDLANKNGITEKQLKDSIIEVKCRKVDEVFKNGIITGKLANMMKNSIKSKTEEWNGTF